MKIIYANIVFFILVLYGIAGAAVERFVSSFWQDMGAVKTEYDVVWSLFSIWLLVTIIGLVLKKPWAYAHALSANAVLAILPIILLSLASFVFWEGLNVLSLLQEIIFELSVSIISFMFFIILFKSISVKKAYNKSSNLTGAENAPPS